MSVINQMLKDLEQRRAQGFDGEGGILGDLTESASSSGRDRDLKLVSLLLLVLLIVVAWLLWDRFTLKPEPVVKASEQQSVISEMKPVVQPVAENKVSEKRPEVVSISNDVEIEDRVIEKEQPVIVTNTPLEVKDTQTSAHTVVAAKVQTNVVDEGSAKSIAVPRIERIHPDQVIASGERTVVHLYGKGFIKPFNVLLEWSSGRNVKVLENWQVELISDSEIRVHFNPGTKDDEWAIRLEQQDGNRSERFVFRVSVPEEKAQQVVATVVPEKPAQQPVLSKTRRKVAPAEQATNLFARASALLKSGRTTEAVDVLRQVLSLDGTHSRARELLASLLFQSQQYVQAADVLKEGLTQQANHIPYSLLLARVYMDQGQDSHAITVLESQKPLARDNGDYYALLAALYQRQARYADAANIYRGLVDVFPGRAVWWMGLGISLQSLNKPEDALVAYKRASKAQGLQPELRKFVQQRIRLLGG